MAYMADIDGIHGIHSRLICTSMYVIVHHNGIMSWFMSHIMSHILA